MGIFFKVNYRNNRTKWTTRKHLRGTYICIATWAGVKLWNLLILHVSDFANISKFNCCNGVCSMYGLKRGCELCSVGPKSDLVCSCNCCAISKSSGYCCSCNVKDFIPGMLGVKTACWDNGVGAKWHGSADGWYGFVDVGSKLLKSIELWGLGMS